MDYTKSTILLVPGALQTSACFDRLRPILEQAGFPTVAGALTSLNPSSPDDCTAAKDGRHLLDEFLLPLLDEGRDVLIFAHSFGGTCLSGADLGLSRSVRAGMGLTGGVIGLVYMSFIPTMDGHSQFRSFGSIWPDNIMTDHPRQGLVSFDRISDTLFNDVEKAQADRYAEVMRPHSMKVINTPVSKPLWQDSAFEGRRMVIRTMMDATFLPPLQDMLIKASGVAWKVVELKAG
ncbi:hypothetical protein LTR78_004175 [Recurvomyces mirabilis]|uniref:AB hydrolase-1 domain-containing protein n=1 Tax=Recurvomyces mirabilis TaxID=574656 RepID=A0AAE0WQ99_9PEZI|nr:hypothetical protein LTR78_004175 [Recurvomyces mirabilis]KAK5153654.1 hypothetical protein LTS14_007348 [Recurvomyces mirabilis]